MLRAISGTTCVKRSACSVSPAQELKNNRLVNASGDQMRMEMLLANPAMVRVTEPFVQNARRAGIDASIKVVDTSQYQVRVDDFDYDLLAVSLNFFPPPGPEQRSYFARPPPSFGVRQLSPASRSRRRCPDRGTDCGEGSANPGRHQPGA